MTTSSNLEAAPSKTALPQRPVETELQGTWGIFGGAFDPLHLGHLTVTSAIKETCHLNRILFVPSHHPPHKPNGSVATFEQRVEMLQLATGKLPWARISTIESTIIGLTFGITVVRALKRTHPSTTFNLIIGADQLNSLSTWHTPDELLEEVPIIVARRPGQTPTGHYASHPRVRIIDSPLIDISSSMIRAAIKVGISKSDLSRLVPAEVGDYIISHRLYQ